MQTRNGLGFGGHGVDIVVGGSVVAKGLCSDPLAESRGLLLQGVGLRPLGLESGGSEADSLLGGGGGLQELSFLVKLGAALGVGGAQGGRLILEFLGGGQSFVPKGSSGGG